MSEVLKRWPRAALVAGTLLLAAAAMAATPAEDPAAAPPSQDAAADSAAATDSPEAGTVAEQSASRLVDHFVLMYGEHLASPDWIARSMAVIGLAQIDDPRTTAKLVEALDTDKTPIVQVYAFEALHARRASLTDEQRQAWARVGRDLLAKDALHGDLRVGLLAALAIEGPTPANKKTFAALFAATSALEPSDSRTLWAMAETLAKWKSPDLVKALITAMGNLNDAYRAELILTGFNAKVPRAAMLADRGSKVMWEETQKAWVDWFAKANLVEQTTPEKPKGDGTSLMPAPEKIEDPSDQRWRKDLELRPLRLRQLDVAFAIDSTGSMGSVITWMERHVTKMMRALAIVSREPRIGLVFYRDQGDEYVVKTLPLTDNGPELAKAVAGIKAKGGGDVPEAVYDALAAAVKGLKWLADRKVIITVADAPPHENTVEATTKLVEKSAETGYRFHFIKARTTWGSADLATFDALATAGKGSSIWAAFVETDASSNWQQTGLAWPDEGKSTDREVIAAVLRSVLSEAYHDRVEAFVNVLMEYVERTSPEVRKSFPPRPPPTPTTQTGPTAPRRDPPKPVDPQQR